MALRHFLFAFLEQGEGKMLVVSNINELCNAARTIGNGAATPEALTKLVRLADKNSIGKLFDELISKAKETAESYRESALKAERWARIAGLTGEDSDFNRAIKLLPEISHPCARARTKKLIVQGYLSVGRIIEARVFAKTIKSAFWGAEAWLEIAKKAGQVKDLLEAITRWDLIADPLAQEEVEAQINALPQSANSEIQARIKAIKVRRNQVKVKK